MSFAKACQGEVIHSRRKRQQVYYTPDYAMEPLVPYMAPFPRVWEPAAGSMHMVNFFRARGHQVTATDIETGHDFLTCSPPEYDILVTNPPFNLRKEFLRRAHELGKPYMLLLPLNTL